RNSEKITSRHKHNTVTGMSLAPDGKEIFVTGSEERHIAAVGGDVLHRSRTLGGYFELPSWSADGEQLQMTRKVDPAVLVLNRRGKILMTISLDQPVASAAYAPDGSLVAVL